MSIIRVSLLFDEVAHKQLSCPLPITAAVNEPPPQPPPPLPRAGANQAPLHSPETVAEGDLLAALDLHLIICHSIIIIKIIIINQLITAANTVMAKLLSWSEKATRVLGTQECERREPVRYNPVNEEVSDLSETMQIGMDNE